jgi:acyl carrier protein
MSTIDHQPGDTGSRRSAPVLGPDQAETEATPGEVAAIIGEILGIGDMATDENFFEMGGNSILALMLISRIEQRWAAKLSMINVIHHATPAMLADLIAKNALGRGGCAPVNGQPRQALPGEPEP